MKGVKVWAETMHRYFGVLLCFLKKQQGKGTPRQEKFVKIYKKSLIFVQCTTFFVQCTRLFETPYDTISLEKELPVM